jgi:uncharacterized cysteine cluster protein YcgN (CxxCxxCC family)
LTFWQDKPLKQLSDDEWELLCDRCGLCCVFKVEDDETGEVFLTNIACPLLNTETCLCSDYENRQKTVPDCAKLTPGTIARLAVMLPQSCAYRRLLEGRNLPDWHPLVTGDPESQRTAGMTARNHLIRAEEAGEITDHIIDQPGDEEGEALEWTSDSAG